MKDILIIPNPLLREKSIAVTDINNEELKLSKKLIKIMNAAPGVGLAAPQIGVMKRIIAINVKELEKEKKISYTLFNPEITWYSKEKVKMEEGCLSIPGQFAEIERPEKIFFKYINEKNNVIEKEASGNESRVIQHELDHLDGKLFIDYLSSLKRNIIYKKINKLKKQGSYEK